MGLAGSAVEDAPVVTPPPLAEEPQHATAATPVPIVRTQSTDKVISRLRALGRGADAAAKPAVPDEQPTQGARFLQAIRELQVARKVLSEAS